ncbi:MAG: hypothetical protein KDA96_22445 [Planctomycetaceae bacterium]|nr:hypothetical protein [Planctomycetaceae bacterium]
MSNNQTNGNKKPSLQAYHVRETGNGRSFWTRIGAAWSNKDGGFTLQLDCIPLDGRIVCQIPKEKDEAAADASSEQ